MKKQAMVIAVIAAVVLASVVSQAQEVDKVLLKVPISFKGKLSDKTAVTDATLATAAGGGTLEFATIQIIDPPFTGTAFNVIGTGIGLTNVISGTTDTFVIGKSLFTSDDAVSLSKAGSKSQKFISAWFQDGSDLFSGDPISNLTSTISNSVLLIQGTASVSKGTNLNGKVEGIWKDSVSAVKGSIKSVKVK